MLLGSIPTRLEPVSLTALDLRPLEGRFFFDGEPYTGVAELRFPNGERRELVAFRRGRREGRRVRWFVDGTMAYRGYFRDGKPEGRSETWWRSGTKRSESRYRDGVTHGVQRRWYANGALFKELRYVNGRERGLQRAWRRNGKLFANYEARDGRVYGLKRANLCFQLRDEEIDDEP